VRTYAAVFDSDTKKYSFIFRDADDPSDIWYRETDYPEVLYQQVPQNLIEALEKLWGE
jgi:hypothetical protein